MGESKCWWYAVLPLHMAHACWCPTPTIDNVSAWGVAQGMQEFGLVTLNGRLPRPAMGRNT